MSVGGKWGFINQSGTMVIQPQFEAAFSFMENLALVQVNGKYGYINHSGSTVIGPKFESAWGFSEGLALVRVNDKYGYIDQTGAYAFEPEFQGAWDFSDGIARGCYPVDIHNPSGTGTVIQQLPPGEAYDIPYRCLTPKGFDNLLIAGRPISSDHAAHSSHRVMPIAACNGEAAGVAAAMCVRNGTDIRGVDVQALRATLKQRGASLYEAGD